MEKGYNKKTLRRLGLIYGIIISLINYIGYVVASSINMPINNSPDFIYWIKFLERHNTILGVASVMTFVIPIVVCVVYSYGKDDTVTRRIINIPVVYSLAGALGWMISFLVETTALVYLQLSDYLNMKIIFITSFLNLSQMCIFISTFAFLVLDLIHRKMVLPRYFPDGFVTSYPGVIKLSTGGLITIFYLSIGIFPVEFLVHSFLSYSFNYDFNISYEIFVVVMLVLLFGIGMTIFFSDHFSNPLKKLNHATKEMTDSNYKVAVDVVSADDYGNLADNFNVLATTLDQKSQKIRSIQDSIIRGMAVMVEQRDNSTGGHINRTSDCVRVFIDYIQQNNKMDLSTSFCNAIIKAAPMHDLGKIAVDDAVLRKPGRFTDAEYNEMKKHAAAGRDIVEQVLSEVDDEEFKNIAVNVAHYHHEKWNGQGYPNGISGEEIPVEARIMALADVFDALVSKRCYKDSMSYDKAFEIISNDLGTHFDPDFGALFLECRPQLEALYNSYEDR